MVLVSLDHQGGTLVRVVDACCHLLLVTVGSF